MLLASLAGCSKPPQQAAPQGAKAALTVELVRALADPANQNIPARGEVVSGGDAIAALPLAMQVSHVLADVGDTVKKGQVLARMDTRLLQAEIAQLRANQADLTAQVAQADRDAQRTRVLHQTHAASDAELEQALARSSTLAAKLAASDAALDAAQVKLGYATLRAPISGVVSQRKITLGQVASPGEALFSLVDPSRLEWRALVSPVQADRIPPGTLAKLEGGVTGKALAQSPTLDTATRSAVVRVRLADQVPAGTVLSGHFVLPGAPAWKVPGTTLSRKQGQTLVARAEQDAQGRWHARLQPVTLVAEQEGFAWLTGLSGKEALVRSGSGLLSDNDLIHVAKP